MYGFIDINKIHFHHFTKPTADKDLETLAILKRVCFASIGSFVSISDKPYPCCQIVVPAFEIVKDIPGIT